MTDAACVDLFDHAFVGLLPGCKILLRKTGESEAHRYSVAEFWCVLQREGAECVTPLIFSESCDQPEFCDFPEEFCVFEFIRAATAADVKKGPEQMADERPGFVGLTVDNRVEYRRPGIDETRTYTLPQFWCLLRNDVARAQQPTYFSSSCDFPDEYGFPGDFCMREFMRAAIEDEVRNSYIRPDTSSLFAAFDDPDNKED